MFTCFRASMMYYVVTLNFPALSWKRSYHRYCKCFRYFNLFVMPTITFTLYLVVCLAETVLRTWKRATATSEVRTMHHSSWRPGLPSGAAGTIFALMQFWFCHVNCWFKVCFSLHRVTCWAVQSTACCGCKKHSCQLTSTMMTVTMKGRTKDTSLSFTQSLRAWQDACSKVNWRTSNW